MEPIEKELDRWKQVLLVCGGAAAALLVIALADVSRMIRLASQPDLVMDVDGWSGAWLVLELATLPAGLILLILPHWRALPIRRRLNAAFGFLLAAWVGWLAFALRTSALAATPAFYWAAVVLGTLLLAAYLLVRKRDHQPEEMFP